jgi:uncharacterized membrane protein
LIGQQPSSFGVLVSSLFFYSFSFLVLVSVWRSYSTILSVLPVETEWLTNLNILLLFIVSIEPYLFNQLFIATGTLWNGISMLYAVDLAVMFVVLGFFNHSLANEEKNLVPKNYFRKYRLERNYDVVVAAVFAISILPIFEFTIEVAGRLFPLRVLVWIMALVLGLVRRVVLPLKGR